MIGSCYPRQAFVANYKPLLMPENEEVSRNAEYALDWLRVKDEDIIYGPNNKQIILKFTKVKEGDGEEDESCFKKKLSIGSCKLLDPKNEKPTNFEFVMPVSLVIDVER